MASSIMAGLNFDTEGISTKPAPDAHPLSTLPWVGIFVHELRTDYAPARCFKPDWVRLESNTATGVFELTRLAVGLDACWGDPDFYGSWGRDSKLPKIVATTVPYKFAVRPFVSALCVNTFIIRTEGCHLLRSH